MKELLNWLPTILFLGCSALAGLILFFQLVAHCDRIIESWRDER